MTKNFLILVLGTFEFILLVIKLALLFSLRWLISVTSLLSNDLGYNTDYGGIYLKIIL